MRSKACTRSSCSWSTPPATWEAVLEMPLLLRLRLSRAASSPADEPETEPAVFCTRDTSWRSCSSIPPTLFARSSTSSVKLDLDCVPSSTRRSPSRMRSVAERISLNFRLSMRDREKPIPPPTPRATKSVPQVGNSIPRRRARSGRSDVAAATTSEPMTNLAVSENLTSIISAPPSRGLTATRG